MNSTIFFNFNKNPLSRFRESRHFVCWCPYSRGFGSQMAVRLSALRAGRPLPPRKFPGTHFCYRLSRPQDHSAAGRIRPIEKSNDLIRNRTGDLPKRIVLKPNKNKARPTVQTLARRTYIHTYIHTALQRAFHRIRGAEKVLSSSKLGEKVKPADLHL
jgi:hypothetical protein